MSALCKGLEITLNPQRNHIGQQKGIGVERLCCSENRVDASTRFFFCLMGADCRFFCLFLPPIYGDDEKNDITPFLPVARFRGLRPDQPPENVCVGMATVSGTGLA